MMEMNMMKTYYMATTLTTLATKQRNAFYFLKKRKNVFQQSNLFSNKKPLTRRKWKVHARALQLDRRHSIIDDNDAMRLMTNEFESVCGSIPMSAGHFTFHFKRRNIVDC